MSKFDYSQTGLPSNPHWMMATDICMDWLGEHMTMFGLRGHVNFMAGQPVAAAKRVFDTCDQFSPECITIMLLGPAKDTLIETSGAERLSRHLFGDQVVDLLKAYRIPEFQQKASPQMLRDIGRMVLAEGVSMMGDQLVGRDITDLKARAVAANNPGRMQILDRQHQVRWSMLTHLEEQADILRGADDKLDVIVADTLVQARTALENIDRALSSRPPQPPRF